MASRPGNFPAAFTSPRADPGLVPGAPGASGEPQPERTRASASHPRVRHTLTISSGLCRFCRMRKTSRTRARPGDKRIDEFTTDGYPTRPDGGGLGQCLALESEGGFYHGAMNSVVPSSGRHAGGSEERDPLGEHGGEIGGLSLPHCLPRRLEKTTFDPSVMQMGRLNGFW